MMRQEIDLSVYFVTNNMVAERARWTVKETVEFALRGGATAIQLREKAMPSEQMVDLGRRLLSLTRLARVPLIINDRVDVAVEIGADGVHVGQKDMSTSEARRLIGPNRILGASATTVKEAVCAESGGASYIGIGPVFTTETKCDAEDPIGLVKLAEIVSAVSIPTVAIGGIVHKNAFSVVRAGVDGVAVISAIAGQRDPCDATRRLLEIVLSANGNGRK